MTAISINVIDTGNGYTNQPKHWTLSESECQALANFHSLAMTTHNDTTTSRGCSLQTVTSQLGSRTNITRTMYYNTADGRLNTTSQCTSPSSTSPSSTSPSSTCVRYQVYNDREPWCTSSDVNTDFTKCKGWRDCNFNPSSSWQDHFNNPTSCTT